jgi:hypothetical protein
MADRFTPGPWKINRTCSRKWGERYFEIWTDEGLQGDRPIARVDGDNAVWLEDGQDIANARLIAAAPELLAALRKAYEPCPCCEGTGLRLSDEGEYVCTYCEGTGRDPAKCALPPDVVELLRRVEG